LEGSENHGPDEYSERVRPVFQQAAKHAFQAITRLVAENLLQLMSGKISFVNVCCVLISPLALENLSVPLDILILSPSPRSRWGDSQERAEALSAWCCEVTMHGGDLLSR
jgi:hypothetical protein